MTPKLILVEGLPSTGKTTTANIIHEVLNDIGIDNKFFMEGNVDHPADYDGTAFFNKQQFKEMVQSFKSYKEDIYELTKEIEEGYIIEYKKGMEKGKRSFPDEFWNELFKNDIYELPLDIHIDLLKKKWIEFAQKAEKENQIYIFDCAFIQNPVTITMIRDNADPQLTINYIKELEEIIKELDPILFYVKQKDLKSSFTKSMNERSKDWLDFFIHYYTKQGYGKEHSYEGLEGVYHVLHARQVLEQEVLKALDIRTYIADNSAFQIEEHKGEIRKLLQKSLHLTIYRKVNLR